MSQIAHRLEDFFKILRVRPEYKVVSPEIETLLLRGLDCLRQVRDRHRQGPAIDDAWLSDLTHPIFTGLVERLGELTAADEDALLVQDEGSESALLVFEGGVESVIEQLKAQVGVLAPDALCTEVAIAAEQLAEYGRMAKIDPFVMLCQTVRHQVGAVPESQIRSYSWRVIELWERANAMVLLGQTAKLSGLQDLVSQDGFAVSAADLTDISIGGSQDFNTADFDEIEAAFERLKPGALDDAIELEEIEAAFNDLELVELAENAAANEVENLQATLGILESEDVAEQLLAERVSSPNVLVNAKGAIPEISHLLPQTADLIAQEIEFQTSTGGPAPTANTSNTSVRIPIDQLRRTSTLFGKLILERNAVNLRLKQVLGITALMKERLYQLEQSNTQLRKWYDLAAVQGAIADNLDLQPPTSYPQLSQGMVADSKTIAAGNNRVPTLFDALEMDRYSDLHLLSQTQMESIVQLKEVAADIDLVLREMAQSATELTRTSLSLQTSVTRMQMRPFADLVKRFPRTIRDLSRQYNKPVNLKLNGETTPIDRAVLDSLSDPLVHLIRNAFDHGIESAEERVNAGKPPTGTIAISAINRSKTTAITVRDDGRGIDLEAIRARARQMGLPEEDLNQSSDSELLELLFEPGFSTASNVTELSGRGVGMDVVRSNVDAVRGSIRIESQPGQGTSITIEVPLMMSVLRVMLLETAGMVFAVPAQTVRTMVHLQADTVRQTDGREQLLWNDSIIPLIRLDRNLQFPKRRKPFAMEGIPKVNRPTAAIFHQLESLGGLHIQRIWGEQEVATTAVNSPVNLPPGFESATILGDGRVIPLIDPVQLLQWVIQNPTSHSPSNNDVPVQPTHLVNGAQPQSILIVDDSINVRRFLAVTLEKSGYQVHQAKDGQEALDMLLRGLSVSAVISDIEMPRLDGYALLSELRSRAEFEHLPITMLTSRASEKHRKLAMKLGASAYLSKPYTEHELLQTIAAHRQPN